MPFERERAFLLTRQWRDARNGIELVLWGRAESGPIRVQLDGQEAVCFVERDLATDLSGLPHRRRTLTLRTLGGAPVDALYFRSRRDLVSAREKIRGSGGRTLESDVKPADRFLMEHFVTGGFEVEGDYEEHVRFRAYRNPKLKPSPYRPELTVLSLDIETGGDGYDDRLLSVSATGIGSPRTFLLRADWEHFHHPEDVELSVHHDETSLLEAFFAHVAHCDPDVLVGWNVIDFDLHVLESKCREHGIAFGLGRGTDRAAILEPSSSTGRRVARIPGRAVLDGIDTLKSATLMFEDFALEAVSQELLGRGKLIADEEHKLREIRRLYRHEPWKLVEYNVEDCKLVEEVFEAAGLIDFALERARLTGLAIDRVGGSVAAFDNLYLPRLHRKGRVAGDVEERTGDVMSPGGYVMDSKPGLLANVIVLDFKSLYPSIIRTFRVDPLGLAEASEKAEAEAERGHDTIEGYRGARFSREHHILPGLIEELWRARDEAKRARNDALSRAIKIIMNSFYGVLGTPGCRFFEPRLAASITLRGHDIIGTSRRWIEAEGYDVVYGDTDSLFVLLGDGREEASCRATGVDLAERLNAKWSAHLRESHGLESFLDLEFETHYLRFFMPTIRGSELGSKKRYAGLVRSKSGEVKLTFTGLEAVRSDWTPLAREFQREVYRRVFLDEPFEDYVRETVDGLFDGRYDAKLVYRKRVRRRLEDYRKNVPPHVQAARKSERPDRWARWVRYVMTVNGPEPVDNKRSALDHQHYLDRQLAPAADALLAIHGTSVARIVDAQLRLF